MASLAAACALTSACASLSPRVGDARETADQAILATGTQVDMPAGLQEFCVRTGACAAEAASIATNGEATRSVGHYSGDASPNNRDAAFAFQLMLNSAALPSSGVRERGELTLTPSRWRELVQVNRRINHLIAPVSDDAQFGVEERWFAPILSAREAGQRPRGDCEDYALEKRQRLLAMGWPPEALALALARLPHGELHTVLVAQTDQGDFVLDNLHQLPRPVSAMQRYEWLSRQVGPALDRWGAARLALRAVS